MKKYFILICLIFISTKSYADLLVYFDKGSKEVVFIVDEKDSHKIRISVEDEGRLDKTKIKGSLNDYDLTEAFEDYKMVGGRFIVNTQKISDRENKRLVDEARAEKIKTEQESAKQKLMANPVQSLTEDEFNALIE